jgi:hypothetical protein
MNYLKLLKIYKNMSSVSKRKVPIVEKKSFSLNDYKKEKGIDKDVKFKKQEYIKVSDAFSRVTGLPGIPVGHVTTLKVHTNTGKSTLLLETAVSAQKNGHIPVFVITEMKWSWEHAKLMGLEFDEVVDENTGEVTYDGDFIYLDRGNFNTIEEMGERILQLISDQEKGKLPFNLCFLIDSIGPLESNLSRDSNKSNNEWDAGAISRVFGKAIIPRVNLSRKENYDYNITMMIITQVWVRKPETYGAMPKLASKGGDTIPFNSSLVITFGNVTNSGTSLLKATKNKKDVVYATRTKVSVEKNHLNGISTSGKLVATPHGFVEDSEKDKIAKEYFKQHSDLFLSILGSDDTSDVTFFEESDEKETNYKTVAMKDDGSFEDLGDE